MKPFILLSDDDENDIFLFKEAFLQSGFSTRVESVNSGDALLEWLESHSTKPALIMLDINMPRLNGLQVLDQLKQNNNYRSIPVIMYSNSPNPSDVLASYEKGANSYLTKPESFTELLTTASTLKEYWLDFSKIPGQYSYFG